jgi:hypothetical protein
MRKPAWLAEVIVQSIAVMVSILLALWVDQWKQRRAARELATESMSNFVKEIRQNKARVDDIVAYHEALRSILQRAEKSHSIRTQAEFQNSVGIDGLRPPFLLQTAWQTAVATGALTHLDYETVSVLSLTYTFQDRFREDSRAGFQSIMEASDFRPGAADMAVHSAENYLREVVSSENDLRATYAQADSALSRKLKDMGVAPKPDSASALSQHQPSTGQ